MPEETKMPETKTESKPEIKAKPKSDPKPKAEPKPAPKVEVVESDDSGVPRNKEGRPRVRVTKNIRANGGRGAVIYGIKGLYFDGDAEKLWTEFPDCVEAFTDPKE